MTHFPNNQVIENSDRSKLASKQETPLVSVIIPCYNHAHFVGEAIQSVLDQHYQHFEIILVDDGSTDNTCEVVAQFGFKVRYIYQQNQGLSAARNTGLRAAQGELVGFLDADDLYEPNYLSTLVASLKSNPQADAVHCACRFVGHINKPLPQIIGKVVPAEKLYSTMLKGNFITPLCMLVYRYCYEKVGEFDTKLTSCEDWDMWLRISRDFDVISNEMVLGRYRVNPESMSTVIERMLDNRLSVLYKNIGIALSENSLLNDDELQAYSRAFLTTSIEYLQSGNQDQAYLCFSRALHLYPPLVEHQDIFYELAWGCTPRGHRGDFSVLDLTHNAQVLLEMLEKVFTDARISPTLKRLETQAYSNAFLVLSQLSYGKGDFGITRMFWLRAVSRDARKAFSKPFFPTIIKSFVGAGAFNRLKVWKSKIINRNILYISEPKIDSQ
jgi:glycosyltransferase involved in cell wall biosynthesis